MRKSCRQMSEWMSKWPSTLRVYSIAILPNVQWLNGRFKKVKRKSPAGQKCGTHSSCNGEWTGGLVILFEFEKYYFANMLDIAEKMDHWIMGKTRSLRHLIINIPMSSGLSEWANEQIKEHRGAHARAKRAVPSNQMSEQCTLFFFSLLFLSLFFLLFPLLLLPLFLLLHHPPLLLLQLVKMDKNLFFMSSGTSKWVNGASECANGAVLYTSDVVLSICITFSKPLSGTLLSRIWDKSDIEIDTLNRCFNLTIEFDRTEHKLWITTTAKSNKIVASFKTMRVGK